MRRRASHPAPHRSVDLSPCLPAARSGEPTVLVRQRSRRSRRHLPALAAEQMIPRIMIRRIASLQPLRWPAAPARSKEQTVEEASNARATGMRSRAFPISPSNSPSRIASCHRQVHRNHHPASFEDFHALRCTHFSVRMFETRNRKTFPPCAETVDDRTSLWKAEENAASWVRKKKTQGLRPGLRSFAASRLNC